MSAFTKILSSDIKRWLNMSVLLMGLYMLSYKPLYQYTTTVLRRQLQFAGHFKRAVDQPVSKFVFLKPSSGNAGQGSKALSYPDLLPIDVSLEPAEVTSLMGSCLSCTSWCVTDECRAH